MDIDISTCRPYLDSLRAYHGVYVKNDVNLEDEYFNENNCESGGFECYMDPTASYTHGIRGHHFDFRR